jgi:hypothetical protein
MRKFLKYIRINYSFEIKECDTVANTKIDIATNTIESIVADTVVNAKIDIVTKASIDNKFKNMITQYIATNTSLLDLIDSLTELDIKTCRKADVRR